LENGNFFKKKEFLDLRCLLLSPYHEGDYNGGDTTDKRESSEDVGQESNRDIG
jgi:hypothetical protein